MGSTVPPPTEMQTLLHELGSPAAAHQSQSEVSLAAGPFAVREGVVTELRAYSQSGRVSVDGDTVTQQLGRGRTAEYSLGQLAAHSKDPEFFANTMRYAAQTGDSVNIDVRGGHSNVVDPTLEQRLPRDFPFRNEIMHASVKHNLDPLILAAVGEQESGMGKGVNYDAVTKLGADKTGHGMWQMDESAHSLADCIRAGNDPMFAADRAAEQLAQGIQDHGFAKGFRTITPRIRRYHTMRKS